MTFSGCLKIVLLCCPSRFQISPMVGAVSTPRGKAPVAEQLPIHLRSCTATFAVLRFSKHQRH